MKPDVGPILLISLLALGLGLGLGLRPILACWDTLARRAIASWIDRGKAVRLGEDGLRPWMRVWGLALLAVPTLVYVLFRSPVLLPVAFFLVYQVPGAVLGILIGRRRKRFRDQLPAVCMTLANADRAGMSLIQGLNLVAAGTTNPIRLELSEICADVSNGMPLARTLQTATDRVDLDGFRLLCKTLETAIEHGGPLTGTLDGIAHAVRENQRLEQKMETLSADGRLTLVVLAAFPALFFVANYLIEPEVSMAYPQTVVGQILLGIVIALTYGSLQIGRRLVDLRQFV